MNTSLCSLTPTVTVFDNRGLTVRSIDFHRHPDTPAVTDKRIIRHQYNTHAFLIHSADPRLHRAGLTNFTYHTDLAGNVLRTQGSDNGTMLALNDAVGRPFMAVNNICIDADGTENRSQAVTRSWLYEDGKRPGRLLSIAEQVTDETVRITERFVYAGNTDAEKDLNLAGACISHYDTAGLVQTDSMAMTGVPLSVTRRLLKNADNPNIIADWQGDNTSAWNDLLVTEAFTSLTTTDATGAVLTTTDTKGNTQRMAYDTAGRLLGSWLTVKDGSEQAVVTSLSWTAAGQKLREEHGNGVVTTYTWEPQTQRLSSIKTERLAGHTSGQKVLQDLRYKYDPVGNVLKISNDAEETRFWRSQKIVPENTYVYDSLYQLVSATGREMANIGQSTTAPLPTDSSAFTAYTRTYTYDEAGNLVRIRHNAPGTKNRYTIDITVSNRSNCGVLSMLAKKPSEVDSLFTAGGQQKLLLPGLAINWTARNELLKVTPVVRDGSVDDSEDYRYDARSQRILKISKQKMDNCQRKKKVVYLPGLELRTTASDGMEKESLQVITIGEAGRAQVRVLHWENGKPGTIDNDTLRWSYDSLIGSSGLELDGNGNVISQEEYYPYGGTAVWAARSRLEAVYKTIQYSGKELDATGLYYYGYRYYQPWAGRWLSADPAGTLDGLNLFRMVQNNPVTLKDNNGLNSINENFREESGDLVYGLAAPRGGYVSSAIGRQFIPDNIDAPATIIDLYNNTVSGQALLSVNQTTLFNFIKSPKKYEKKLSPKSNIKELVKSARNYPLWEHYFMAGEINQKFNVEYIYKEVRKSPGKSQYHQWHMSGAQMAPKLLWKRGSKLGIEMAASGAGNKIHFVLDNLDVAKIVSKEGTGGQSITASELRYAYRNRQRLAGNIHFYKNSIETESPWDSAPDLWGGYNPKSKLGINEGLQITKKSHKKNIFTSARGFFKGN